MKIIAHIGRSEIIAQLTRDEFAKLTGNTCETALIVDRYDDGYAVGRELNVSDIYNRLKSQEQIKDRMNSAAASLRALADLLETIKPIADEVVK